MTRRDGIGRVVYPSRNRLLPCALRPRSVSSLALLGIALPVLGRGVEAPVIIGPWAAHDAAFSRISGSHVAHASPMLVGSTRSTR